MRRALFCVALLVTAAGCLDFEKAHQLCLAEGRCSVSDADGGGPGAPVIQQHPASVTVVAGREASFYASATGADPLTWEWYADSALLADGPGTGKLAGAVITGASSTTLRVWLVPLKADGVAIKARARNGVGSQFSDAATLRLSTSGRVELVAGRLGGPGAADGVGANARFGEPRGLTLDVAGNLIVADTMSHTIRRVTPEGAVTTIAGRAGYSGYENRPQPNARFFEPSGLARNDGGTVASARAGESSVEAASASRAPTRIRSATPRRASRRAPRH